MTDKQPEALRITEWLETSANTRDKQAVAELRRLYALNAELIAALEQMTDVFFDIEGNYGNKQNDAMDAAHAALAKAEGK